MTVGSRVPICQETTTEVITRNATWGQSIRVATRAASPMDRFRLLEPSARNTSTRKERYRFRTRRGMRTAWQRKNIRLIARFIARPYCARSSTDESLGSADSSANSRMNIASPLGQVIDQNAARVCLQARSIGGHSAFSSVRIETEKNIL